MINRTNIVLKAQAEKVIPLFLELGKKERFLTIIENVQSMSESHALEVLTQVYDEFEHRHFAFRDVVMNHFHKIENIIPAKEKFSETKKLLIGSFLTKEYSVQAAALFNPSIVPHPNQEGLEEGEMRFVMSLRAVGEGHISSIMFSTGVVTRNGEISLDEEPKHLICPIKKDNLKFSRSFLEERAKYSKGFDFSMLDDYEEGISHATVEKIPEKIDGELVNLIFKTALERIFDNNYDVDFKSEIPINSRVIFPLAKSESMGMEDVRFVKFTEKGEERYIGTFTAYNGKEIVSKIIETNDFCSFRIRSLHGKAATDKGMALFPEKINGQYAMIGRQGGRCLSIMFSDDLYFWHSYQQLQTPSRSWEFTQMGNCGSPIKTEKGWLLLTHAVGPMRKYVMSASLLDLENPTQVLASLDKPLISPNAKEREGYVPNVVYSCGALQHHDNLIIPYAMSDSASSIATININTLLHELLQNK